MSLIETIRAHKRDKLLARLALVPHRKCIKPLDNVKSIGVVAHALTIEERGVLQSFTHHMNMRSIMVQVIELPEDCEGLLEKSGLPIESFISLFLSYKYDMVIDTTPAGDLFGLYVVLRAECLLRVGYDDTDNLVNPLKNESFDLLIRGSGPRVLDDYLANILKLLVQVRK